MNKRTFLTVFLLAGFSVNALADSVSASQAWVKMKLSETRSGLEEFASGLSSTNAERIAVIANDVAEIQRKIAEIDSANGTTDVTSNGVRRVETKYGDATVVLTVEEASVDAVVVTDAQEAAVAYGITNGICFVRDEAGLYNGGNEKIYCTSSNLVWRGIQSSVVNGRDSFPGYFSVVGTLIQPHVANAITNTELSVRDMGKSPSAGGVRQLFGASLRRSGAADDEDVVDWYAPYGWEDNIVNATGTLLFGTQEENFSVILNEAGGMEFTSSQQEIESIIKNDPVLAAAVSAMQEALRAKAEVIHLAKNTKKFNDEFNALFSNGNQLTSKDDKGSSGGKGTIKFSKSGQGEDTKISVELSGAGVVTKPDDRSIRQNSSGKFELGGWSADDNMPLGLFDLQSTLNGYAVVTRSQRNGQIAYMPWYGVDRISLCASPYTHRLEISGWYDGSSNGMTDLATVMLKDESKRSDTFDRYSLVARNKSKGVVYIDVGHLSASGADVDGVSLTTNTTDGAVRSGVVSLRGWNNANQSASSGSPYLPYSNGGNNLEWRGILDFFNVGLFDLTQDGKINLKGVSADADDIRVMTVTASGDSAAVNSSSLADMVSGPLDVSDRRMTLVGWSEGDTEQDTLAHMLTNSASGASYRVLARKSGGHGQSADLGYVSIGSLLDPDDETLEVDDSSITTNSTKGAVVVGSASLFGFAGAKTSATENDPKLPTTKGGDLDWRSLSSLADGTSVSVNQGTGRLEITGASEQKANSRYFGTPNEGTVALGWYDLPNATTNRVEGDEATITTVANQNDVKRLGLIARPGTDASVAKMENGVLAWSPLTNELSKIEVDEHSINRTEDGKLQLSGWDGFSRGVLGKGRDGELVSEILGATNGLEVAEVPGESIDIGLAGWDDGNSCDVDLVNVLTNKNESLNRSQHKILTRFSGGASPVLHYMSIEGIINATDVKVDGASIEKNASDEGKLRIKGIDGNRGKLLLSSADGAVHWISTNELVTVLDNLSLRKKTGSGEVELCGFGSAPEGTMPYKAGVGVNASVEWLSTNFITKAEDVNTIWAWMNSSTLNADFWEDRATQLSPTTGNMKDFTSLLKAKGAVVAYADDRKDRVSSVYFVLDHEYPTNRAVYASFACPQNWKGAISGRVLTVNGIGPDDSGNIEIEIPEGGEGGCGCADRWGYYDTYIEELERRIEALEAVVGTGGGNSDPDDI